MEYHENYPHNPVLKNQFLDFLILIFGLDLRPWEKAGYWDTNYRPFTYFQNGRAISHVCLYSMDMTVNGRRTRVAQISGVGTHPDYRRQGLNRELTEKAIAWARPNHDFFFLFSDADAVSFYQKCGFRPVKEQLARTSLEGTSSKPGLQKLDMSSQNHRDMIWKIAQERSPVSDRLGIQMPKLFMFWCMYFLKDSIYYIPELDCLISYTRNDGHLIINDIVGRHIPEFSEIYPFIADENDIEAEFLFMIDKMNLSNTTMASADENNHTHLMGSFPLEGTPFLLPLTCHA